MTDYPAAHSMDTTWFAVDQDGHVAAFETGEAGAVPTEAYLGEDVPHDELRALPRTPDLVDVDGLFADDAGTQPHVKAIDGLAQDVVVELAPGAEVDDELRAALGAHPIATTTGSCLAVSSRDVAAFARLHDRGLCRRCIVTFDLVPDGEEGESLSRFGLYNYQHTTDNWIAGPYARASIPERPLARGDLPAEIRDNLVEFPGSFAQVLVIQPAELWPSEAWGAAWLATDRTTVRPFPGRAGDYAAEIAMVHEVDPSLVVLGADGQPFVPPPRVEVPGTRPPWWKFWRRR